jgi:hypothetical protein
MAETYPDYIMQCVRQNLGLRDSDTSRDEYILKMPKSEILERVGQWNCIIHFGNSIRHWIKDIYGLDLKD